MGNGIWLKKYFEGTWLFQRRIFSDADQSSYGIAVGMASFARAGKKNLIYKEEGKLYLTASGKEFSFLRSFMYAFEADQLAVFFNDGFNSGQLYQRYSIDKDKGVLRSSVQHSCKDDFYNGIYTIVSPTEYRLETLIKGLKKEFKIETYATKT